MFSLRSLLIIGIVSFNVLIVSRNLHAEALGECASLFKPVKNVGAKTELRSRIEQIEKRLAADGVHLADLILSIRPGNRARVVISQGETEVAYGFLRPSEQAVHAGHVSIEQIRVNFEPRFRGLVPITYLLLAREAIREGLILETSWDLSDNDRADWSALVKLGWAKKIDHVFSEFDLDFISEPETIETVDQLTARFARR